MAKRFHKSRSNYNFEKPNYIKNVKHRLGITDVIYFFREIAHTTAPDNGHCS